MEVKYDGIKWAIIEVTFAKWTNLASILPPGKVVSVQLFLKC